MPLCTITYNGNTISSVVESYPVSVTYGGSTIASINPGYSKKINCKGQHMSTDIVVGTKTLNCAGKIMEDDITITMAQRNDRWYLNYNLSYPFVWDTQFTSNGRTFLSIQVTSDSKPGGVYYYSSDSGWEVMKHRNNVDWYNDSYRYITLAAEATGYRLTWLEQNATRF